MGIFIAEFFMLFLNAGVKLTDGFLLKIINFPMLSILGLSTASVLFRWERDYLSLFLWALVLSEEISDLVTKRSFE